MTSLRSKITGMFFGVAIGDALGKPVETFSKSKIDKTFGRITKYESSKYHKWFDGDEIGTITDDTQLTIAVAESIIESNGLNMDSIAKWHVDALSVTDAGWGNSTRLAVKNLQSGINWSNSAIKGENYGVGNGVAMKVSPISAYYVIKSIQKNDYNLILDNVTDFLVKFNNMTHLNHVSLKSTGTMFSAFSYCLAENNEFNPHLMSESCFLYSCLNQHKSNDNYELSLSKDNLSSRIYDLFKNYKAYSESDIIEKYNGGGCYCYDSIPFSLYFFLKNPNSIDSLFEVVSSGGDTDSNGSMVGGLLGALNGVEIFPQYLIDGLKDKEQIYSLANRFCDVLGVD